MEWNNEGSAPSAALVESGFKGGYKPPASVFNYFLHIYTKCLKELQNEALNREDIQTIVEETLTQANASGEFDGEAASILLRYDEETGNLYYRVVSGKPSSDAKAEIIDGVLVIS
jgi:hypothetical protein